MTNAVRDATAADLPGIAHVHVSSWEGAYRGMVPDRWLDARTVDGQLAMWRDVLAGPGRTLLLVAEGADGISGFCSANLPSRDDDADEDTAEIATLYVDPAHWRTGAGGALLEAMVTRLTTAGFETATLWVLEPNAGAQAFYARSGFSDDGGRQTVGPGWPPELRLRRTLGV